MVFKRVYLFLEMSFLCFDIILGIAKFMKTIKRQNISAKNKEHKKTKTLVNLDKDIYQLPPTMSIDLT